MIMKILHKVGDTDLTAIEVTQVSPLSGETNTRKMFVYMDDFYDWREGEAIQVAMPYLCDDQREFLKTGITEKEWDETFG